MNLPEFLERRQGLWDELAGLVARAGHRPERLGPDGVLRLGTLYRATLADLAYARRRYPGDPVVDRLERLVVAARGLVYERPSRRPDLVAFFVDDYWRLVRARMAAVGLAAVLLLAPAVIAGLWAAAEPEAVVGALPPGFLWVTEAETTDQGYSVVGLTGFSTFVFANNARVALLSFALGITYGLGTALVLVQNGLILGGVTGLAADAGNLDLLVAAVVAHGVLELSCIVVAGGAGLGLARAILRPGDRTRRRSLADEAVPAFQIAAGTAAWLALAGVVEGFVSRVGLGPVPTTVVGLVLGGVFWALVAWRGRALPVTAEPAGVS
jgi:uncharacterized membrane protein SpoIIM required for sporulation